MKRRARPSLTSPLQKLIRDIAQRMPQFAHIRAESILVVAGEARRASHASVRPLAFSGTRSRISKDGRREKPRVRIEGQNILYVITLRPIWFRASKPDDRVATVLHELFHMSTRFDGTLHSGRRHSKMGKDFARKLGPLVRRYLDDAPPKLLAPFSHRGLVKVRMWLERPPSSLPRDAHASRSRRVYTEEQLFLGLVRMR